MRFYTTDRFTPISAPTVKRIHPMLISCIAALMIAACGHGDNPTEAAAAADAANTSIAAADSSSATSKSVTTATGSTTATTPVGSTGSTGVTAAASEIKPANATASTIAASYPNEQKLSAKVPLAATPMPAYLTNSTDASTGSLVVKITDAIGMGVSSETVLKHAYAKNQPWNADSSLLFLGNSYPGFLLDGKTFKLLRRFSQPSQALWSNTDPNIMFGVGGDAPALVKADVRAQGTVTVLRRFDEYTKMDIGGYEGNLSNDDRYIVLFGKHAAGVDIVAYNIASNQIEGRRSFVGQVAGAGSNDIDNATISPLGNFVVVQFVGSRQGRPPGIDVYDRQMNYLRRVSPAGNSHYDIGIDAAGNEVLVIKDSQVDTTMYTIRLSDGTRRVELTKDLVNYPIHISCRNIKRPGWCYMSEFAVANYDQTNATSKANHQELLAVKLDGSGTVQRFAQEQHAVVISEREYERSAMGVPNRDGSMVLWASDWRDASRTASIDTYVAMAKATAKLVPSMAPARGSSTQVAVTLSTQIKSNLGVSKVEFFKDSVKLGEVTKAPHLWTWTGAPGTYQFSIKLTDSLGNSVTAAESVTVQR